MLGRKGKCRALERPAKCWPIGDLQPYTDTADATGGSWYPDELAQHGRQLTDYSNGAKRQPATELSYGAKRQRRTDYSSCAKRDSSAGAEGTVRTLQHLFSPLT